jgi:hypothetical protein
MHVYGVTPRKDKRGFDLISDALPFAGLRSGGATAAAARCPRRRSAAICAPTRLRKASARQAGRDLSPRGRPALTLRYQAG